MSRIEQVRLVSVEHERKITKETNGQFLFEYQRAILLSLKDGRVLNEAQYRSAEEKLKKQMRIGNRTGERRKKS